MCYRQAINAGMQNLRGAVAADGAVLTPGDLAVIESRMNYPARLLQRAWRDDVQAQAELRGWLAQRAAEESCRRGWKTNRGEARCVGMAKVVCRELLAVGWPALSGHEAAREMDMAESSLREGPWLERLEWLRRVGKDIERQVRITIQRELYDS